MARFVPMTGEFWIEQLRLCLKLGLKVYSYPVRRTFLSPENAARLTEAADGCVFTDSVMEENTSMLGHGSSLERLKGLKRCGPHAGYGMSADKLVPPKSG